MKARQLGRGLLDAFSWHRWWPLFTCFAFYQTYLPFVLYHTAMAGWEFGRDSCIAWIVVQLGWERSSVLSWLTRMLVLSLTLSVTLWVFVHIRESTLHLQHVFVKIGQSSARETATPGFLASPGAVLDNLIQDGVHMIGYWILFGLSISILNRTWVLHPLIAFVLGSASMENVIRRVHPELSWKARIGIVDSEWLYLIGFGALQVVIALQLNNTMETYFSPWVLQSLQPLWVVLMLPHVQKLKSFPSTHETRGGFWYFFGTYGMTTLVWIVMSIYHMVSRCFSLCFKKTNNS